MKKFAIFLLIAALATNGAVHAQGCSGEVMHFRETFGNGTTAAPLAAGRTNYNYNGTGSLADGDYKLSNSTQGRPEWYNVPDRTGDVNGRMMVINASYSPGEFYRDTVFGLSSTRTYSVYFYAMNVNTPGTCSPNPILPVLEIVVESYNSDGTFTHLSTIVSDSLRQTSPATWVRIAGTYYLPVNTTAIRYRIINRSTGGCGNDVAIDDITFSQCQPAMLATNGLTLKGRKEKGTVRLDWNAKGEYASFDVERSENGRAWMWVKNIKATASNQYSTNDSARHANVQYRVSAISKNGQRYTSNVIAVSDAASTPQISAFPNPFGSEFQVQYVSESDQPSSALRVFDLRGNMVSSSTWNIRAGENRTRINGTSIQPGVYFVSLVNRHGEMISHQRLVKK